MPSSDADGLPGLEPPSVTRPPNMRPLLMQKVAGCSQSLQRLKQAIQKMDEKAATHRHPPVHVVRCPTDGTVGAEAGTEPRITAGGVAANLGGFDACPAHYLVEGAFVVAPRQRGKHPQDVASAHVERHPRVWFDLADYCGTRRGPAETDGGSGGDGDGDGDRGVDAGADGADGDAVQSDVGFALAAVFADAATVGVDSTIFVPPGTHTIHWTSSGKTATPLPVARK